MEMLSILCFLTSSYKFQDLLLQKLETMSGGGMHQPSINSIGDNPQGETQPYFPKCFEIDISERLLLQKLKILLVESPT